MKNTIVYFLWSALVTLLIVLVVSIVGVFSTINKANAYHQTAVEEMQSSNFSSSVIDKYRTNTDPFVTRVIDKTVTSNSLERTGRVFEVVTTYEIKLPIVNYSKTKTIHGFAR